MNYKETLKNKYSILVFIDIIMMVLLIANLSLIIFDFIFAVSLVNQFLEAHLNHFYTWYHDKVHTNFHLIDLTFVAVFLTEFMFSWILAIIQKVYHKWFFYPFIHFYDLLGCIPVGSLRFLRILRVFSILVRLQNLKIIDLSNTYVMVTLKKYYGILVEEVSDRVVVKVLEGVQDEISSGGQVLDDIIEHVIRPKQDLLAEWISRRIEIALEENVLVKKKEIQEYVENLISEGLGKNAELQTIEQIPVMGKKIAEIIENTISNIINNIIETALRDLASYKNRKLVTDATEMVLNSIEHKDKDDKLNDIFKDISLDVINVIIKQVKIQQWKLEEKVENEVKELSA